jgi:phosphoribosylformylglycinamidine synthase
MEKLLIECTLELFQADVINGIQDFGAAGISCATSELASAGDGGMFVNLDLVPLRDPNLAPEEILMSESQERMMAVVEPANVERFMEICAKWDVQATVVGEVIEGDRLIIQWHGETIVDVDPKTVAHEGPVYERPYHRPGWLDAVNADRAEDLPRDNSPEALKAALVRVLAHGNIADKTWVTEQYDRYVRGNSVLAQPEDSGMLRIDEETGLGIALALDANSRFSYLNPYLGAQLSLAESYRNVAVTGAEPVAITDCLNFGSPEDPEVMWQFAEAVMGLVDGCRELGVPVTGGNVSLYNQTATAPILPTPTVGVLGVIDDVATRIRSGFAHPGDAILLLGETREELSGSIWASVIHDGHLGGLPPAVVLGEIGRAHV